MEKYPIVSVVTPSYNQGKFLEKTIVSIISQEGNFYLQYLVMDGGSGDESVEIIRKYEQIIKENRFPLKCRGIIEYTWLSGPDEGQSSAINKGLKMARGEIIGWLNSDDTYLPGTIGKVVDELRVHPDVSLIYGNCNFIDQGDSLIKTWNTGLFSKKILSRFCPIAQPAAFFRDKTIREVGLLNPSLHFAMDYEFWIRIFKKGLVVKKINVVLANYRLYPECKSFSGYAGIGELLWIVFQHFKCNFSRTFKTYILQFNKERKTGLKTARDFLASEMLKCEKEKSKSSLKGYILRGYLLARLEYFALKFFQKT